MCSKIPQVGPEIGLGSSGKALQSPALCLGNLVSGVPQPASHPSTVTTGDYIASQSHVNRRWEAGVHSQLRGGRLAAPGERGDWVGCPAPRCTWRKRSWVQAAASAL